MPTPVAASPPVILQFFNNSGQPLVGGSVLTQVGSVNTATYQDPSGSIPLPNPIPLNSRGEVSNATGISCQLFLQNGIAYTFTLFDAAGNQINQAQSVTAAGIGAIFSSLSVTSDSDGMTAQLASAAGVTGMRWNDQVAARKAEAIFWGSTSTPSYGMTASSFGLNTAAAVPMTFGTGDAVRMTIDPTTGFVGFGLGSTAAQGQVQLLGSATGGIKLGNVNNTYSQSLDWYEEGTFTPILRFGGASTGMIFATQLGSFTRIGNIVFMRLRVTLSAKGTAIGVATITGLPYAPNAATPNISEGAIFGEFLSMTALSAGVVYALGGQGGSLVLTLFALDQMGSTGTVATRSDAAFTNGSSIEVTFNYQVA